MSQLDRWLTESGDAFRNGWSDSANEQGSPSLHLNVLTGVVSSRTIGLTRTTLRIRVGERTDLRVRWQADSPARCAANIGDRVHLTIPAETIQLEAGGFRRGKQRWNRWVGRVVLVDRNDEAPVTTVKLHRDNVTLNSIGRVIGTQGPLTVWDTVNIVVDPQQVSLTPVRHPYSQVIPGLSLSLSLGNSHPSPLWLRATIRSVRSIPAGLLVTLNLGSMNLSVLIEHHSAILSPWRVGASVDINTDRPQARIRQFAEGPPIPCSVVRSGEHEMLLHSVHIHRTHL